MVSSKTFDNLFEAPKFGQAEYKRKEFQDKSPHSRNRSNIDYVKEDFGHTTEYKRKELQDKSPHSRNRSNVDYVTENQETIRIKDYQPKGLKRTEGIYRGLERGNTNDFQFTTPKNLINGKESISGLSGSEESSGGNDSISSSKRGLVLKHKLMQLSDKYRKQKILLVQLNFVF